MSTVSIFVSLLLAVVVIVVAGKRLLPAFALELWFVASCISDVQSRSWWWFAVDALVTVVWFARVMALADKVTRKEIRW